jgi:hypothetical protein
MINDNKWVTKDHLEAKLAAINAKFRFALLVQTVCVIALLAALYTLFG